MAYSEKKKNEVIDLYESGMPRVKIAKRKGSHFRPFATGRRRPYQLRYLF